ncbi:MAG: hypothetical protein ABEH56_03385 [Salinirussus sp.]
MASDRPADAADAPSASDVAARLRAAEFVRLVADATGDALAATGLLATALDGPYQATVAGAPGTGDRDTGADLTVGVGRRTAGADVVLGTAEPASRLAYDAAEQLGGADPVLAMAGLVAAGAVPTGAPLDAADLPRRPGLAVPTDDPVDGLAHTTLVHCEVSGSPDATEALLAGSDALAADDDARRRRASLVAVDVAGDGTPRGAEAVERAIRPRVGGPFRTVGGYADVLDALARQEPGTGLEVALGGGNGKRERERALDAWRSHGRRVHAAVREATTARYDGIVVAGLEGTAPLGSVTRLIGDFRTPEPAVLTVADGRAVLRAVDRTEADRVLAAAAEAVGGRATGTADVARSRFDADGTELAAAVREAV